MRGRDLRFLRLSGAGEASTSANGKTPPKRLLGAAWRPQRQRMDAGIYFPLFLVLVTPKQDRFSIYYLSADLQSVDLSRSGPRSASTRSGRDGRDSTTTWKRPLTG
jgi:hypothetical protein